MTLIDILTVSKQKHGAIKYVRLGDQTFRFMKVDGLGSHADLVEPHAMPISAGFIAFDLERDPPSIRVMNTASITLNLSPAPDDEALLRTHFSEVAQDGNW